MSVKLVRATYDNLLYVTERLRAADVEELFATQYDDDRALYAQRILSCGDFQWVAELDGEPVASIGAYPVWPRVWQVWAFGTDKWPKVVLSLTRHVRRSMMPTLKEHGTHRAQCFAMASHTSACAWLEYLGAHAEARLRDFGRAKQDFVLYAWTAPPVSSEA